MRAGACFWAWAAVALALLTHAVPAAAQQNGFQLNRYEPTPSGTWFFLVEHPYFATVPGGAFGLNLSYAHEPLRYVETDAQHNGQDNVRPIIAHQLIAHLDYTTTFIDRLMLNLSVPLVLLETGQPAFDISPSSTVVPSDPRLMGTVRLRGRPEKDKWSVSASLALWFPLRAVAPGLPQQVSDSGARFQGSVIFAGLYRWLIWSGTLTLGYRSPAQLGMGLQPDGTTVGPDIRIGLAAGLYLPAARFSVGPEFLLATSLLPTQALTPPYTSIELLLGAQHNVAKWVQIGAAAGLGFLSAPGTPDARVLLRVAYSPVTRDRDQDGIPDVQDACPDEKGVRSDVPSNNGCPLIPDRDCDGIPDAIDECPDEPEGRRPDPTRLGCPLSGSGPAVENSAPSPLTEPPPAGTEGPHNGP